MAVSRSPTLATLAAFVVVFAVQSVAGLAGAVGDLFVLSAPVTARPWTLLTSVYAHAGLGHLLANAAALLLPGLLVERKTTPVRYHAFFLGTGALAGVAEVTIGDFLGPPTGVLGASGAVFGLLGYLLVSNRLTDTVVGSVAVSGRTQVVVLLAVALLVTAATGRPGVALIAHATGLFVGLVAGRAHLLRP